MLKSTLNAAKPLEPKRPTLPHLFHSSTGAIALFDNENTATILYSACYKNGQHLTSIGSCWNENQWTPLKPGESVTITVEED